DAHGEDALEARSAAELGAWSTHHGRVGRSVRLSRGLDRSRIEHDAAVARVGRGLLLTVDEEQDGEHEGPPLERPEPDDHAVQPVSEPAPARRVGELALARIGDASVRDELR